jgi:hypothetical protein
MKKFLTLIAVAAMAFAAQANILTVAEGTGEAQYAPFYGFQMDALGSISQVIYPADMLADMNGGTITEIKFYPTQAFGALGSGNLQISLKEVEQDRYTSTTLVTDATVVGNAYPVQGNAEWVIVFDQPFEYHGGNLMIETELIQVGSFKATKFFGQSFSYAVGIAQYKYTWGTEYYYEAEQVLPMATFTYEEGGSQDEGITLLSQANALEDAAEFTFNGDAVVTVCWKGSVYLRDDSGYGQIAGFDGTFENGVVLSQGWNATKTSDNGWVKYTDATDVSASDETNAELAAAQKLTGGLEESMLNAYVYAENVSKGFMPIRSFKVNGETITLTGTGNQPATGNYNIYGVIWKVGDALQFEPVKWEVYVEPQPEGLRGDVNLDNDVTIADASALIDYLLTHDATGISLENANCNLDEEVTIADASALIDYLLTHIWAN